MLLEKAWGALTKKQYFVVFDLFAVNRRVFDKGSIRFQRLTTLATYLLLK